MRLRLHFWHLATGEDFVHEAISSGFLSSHVVVAIGVVFDLLDGLAGVMGEDAIEAFFQIEHEANGAFDIRGGAARATGHLVNHHVGIRQAKAFALGAGSEKHGTHRGTNADAIGVHVASHELHRVVDRKTCGDRASGGVDVNVDVLFRVLHLQEKKLGDHGVSNEVIDACADKNDAILEQARVDIERSFAAAVGLDDDGNVVAIFRSDGSRKLVHASGVVVAEVSVTEASSSRKSSALLISNELRMPGIWPLRCNSLMSFVGSSLRRWAMAMMCWINS